MATVTRTTTWSDAQVLSAAALNGEFNNALNALSLVNADISGSAAIAASKISGTAATLAGPNTMTNTTITKRVQTAADATSIDVNSDNYDATIQINTQAGGTLTLNNPTGTPIEMRGLIYRIKCSNGQTYAFGNLFKAGTVALPATHAGSSKFDYLGFLYNFTSSTWDLVAYAPAVG